MLIANILNRVQNVTGFALDFGVLFIYIVFTFRLFRGSHFFLLCSLSLNDFEAVIQRAIAHRDGGDLEAAVAGFDAAVAIRDSDSVVFVQRGIAYGQLGSLMRRLRILIAQSLWHRTIRGCGAIARLPAGLMGSLMRR